MNPSIAHPTPSEHAVFYSGYLERVRSETHPIETLAAETRFWSDRIGSLGPSMAGFAYAPGKWTLTELTRHLADTEAVFCYRLLSALRGETQALPGFDEKAYQNRATADGDTLQAAMKSLKAQRLSWEALVSTVRSDQETRTVVANGHSVSVRALVWMVCGHARHHREVVERLYFTHPDFPAA
ncbi:DUF664 domain-containing protein [bacterium]|nr:DUF664 domain-containing protein [bacterium]